MKGKFIAFEGQTGSGKKTHISLLTKKLEEIGQKVTKLSFPSYDTEIARLTKRKEFDPYTLSLLYAADRSQYQERIKALLDEGVIVITDRYCYSNFVYQSAKGIPLEWLIELERHIIKPNIVFLIDVPVEVSIRRVQQATIENFTKKEILDRLERERELLKKIREAYLQLAKTDRSTKWYVIDGTQELSRNHQQIWGITRRELRLL